MFGDLLPVLAVHLKGLQKLLMFLMGPALVLFFNFWLRLVKSQHFVTVKVYCFGNRSSTLQCVKWLCDLVLLSQLFEVKLGVTTNLGRGACTHMVGDLFPVFAVHF